MRILLAEDDYVLADAIIFGLNQSDYAVDWVENGEDAKYSLTNYTYDAAILDLGLPKIDGLQVLKDIRQQQLKLPVLVLTARSLLEDRVTGLQIGADDYLTKPFSFSELEARLRALIRRYHFNADNNIVIGPIRYDTIGRRVYVNDKPIDLSSKELSLLEIFLMHVGHIVSKQQMVEHLYGWDEKVSFNAIEVYIHRLRKKLESAGFTFRTIRGLGYILEETA